MQLTNFSVTCHRNLFKYLKKRHVIQITLNNLQLHTDVYISKKAVHYPLSLWWVSVMTN